MRFLAAILLLALTRAEIIQRFHATPARMCEGLVEVVANCPADMRRAYQLPVAGYAARICRSLAGANGIKSTKRAQPGIVVVLGDATNAVTNVVSRVVRRPDGSSFTKIFLQAPGYADMRTFTAEVSRGFFRAVKDEDPDLETALAAYRRTDLRALRADKYEALRAWREEGAYSEGRDDEDYLKLQREVIEPGRAAPPDVLNFAARLRLYPTIYAAPFAGTHDACDFREAVALAKKDPAVRYAAFLKAQMLPVVGGGRGPLLQEAAESYARFLMDVARGDKDDFDLYAELDTAEAKLKGALQ